MLRIELGSIGNAFFKGTDAGNILQIETGTTLNIIRDYAVLRPDLGMNILGLHTAVPVSGDGKLKWGKFKAASHVARKRDNSCTWRPGGGTKFGVETADICNKQHQTEHCVGSEYDSCWEKLLGIGTDINNIDATAEGSRLLNILISKEYETIGNDYYDLAYFANHTLIQESEDNGYWMANNVSASDWDNFYTMSTDDSCGGFLTQLEDVRTTEGYDHFNVEIYESDVDGALYTGDTFALFRRVLAARTHAMKTWNKSRFDNPIARPIISVSQGIFDRYKEQLTQQYNGILTGFTLFFEGEGGISMPMADILRYDGYWILARPDWAVLDAMTGYVTHMVVMTAPGVLGLGYDVPPTEQYKGMGLIVSKWDAPPFLGKTYFHTNYRLGTMILDTDYVVYGRLFLAPTNV